jgi:transcriptional regulator with XRE-family HTH domain
LEDLHRESKVSKNAISALERGGAARYTTARKLAAALGVEPSALLETGA